VKAIFGKESISEGARGEFSVAGQWKESTPGKENNADCRKGEEVQTGKKASKTRGRLETSGWLTNPPKKKGIRKNEKKAAGGQRTTGI